MHFNIFFVTLKYKYIHNIACTLLMYSNLIIAVNYMYFNICLDIEIDVQRLRVLMFSFIIGFTQV